MAKYETHDFYCLRCGGASIPIQRKQGHQHSSLHRKKLYCWRCKLEINHIEIRNQIEFEEFKENFKNGVYVNECEESLAYCCGARRG